MSVRKIILYEFMPYGAPELQEVAEKYLTRALSLAMGGLVLIFLSLIGLKFYVDSRPQETSTIVVRGFEGKRKPPVAIAFVRLDGVDSAIGNYVDDLDLSDYEAAMRRIAPGKRVRVRFAPQREGRITDFSFVCID